MSNPDAPYDPFAQTYRSSGLPTWILEEQDRETARRANNRVVNPGLCEQLDRIEAKLDALIAASAAK